MSPTIERIYAAANKVFRSANRELNWETQSSDLTSNAKRDIVTMGEGQRHPDRQGRRIQAADVIRSPSGSAPASPTQAPTTATSTCRATAAGRGPTWPTRFPARKASGCRRSCRHGSTKRPPTPRSTATGERLRSVCLRDARFRQTWQSAAGNLKGEVVKTLTEDLKNQDVLYVGAETGLSSRSIARRAGCS